jgi:MarR family transcriptional regulator, organic hydroperoxide resistance regulator
MTFDREQMISDIVRASQAVFRALNPYTASEWLGLELTMAQLKALFALAGQEPMTVGALGQALQIQLPAASHAVKSLVRLGLAQRLKDENDLRCTYIHLTPYAEDLVDQLRQGSRDAFRSLLAGLTDDELAAAQRGLGALAAASAQIKPARPLGDVQAGPCNGSAGHATAAPYQPDINIDELSEVD